MITRSEAAHKLKCVIAILNRAIEDVNNGRWLEADQKIWNAQDDLDNLQPYIDEVAGMPMSRPTGARPYPEPVNTRPAHPVGSLAYGMSPPLHSVSYGTSAPRTAPPPPLKKAGPAPPPPPLKTPGRPPIIVPPPEPVQSPIITPPPAAEPQYEPARVSIFPVEYDDIPPTTFDFAALDSGQVSTENAQMRKLFASLPEDTRQALRRQYDKTGKPVTCKIRMGQ